MAKLDREIIAPYPLYGIPHLMLMLMLVLFNTGMEIGIWMSVGYITQAIGLQTSDASVCAFLCSLTVVCLRPVLFFWGGGYCTYPCNPVLY